MSSHPNTCRFIVSLALVLQSLFSVALADILVQGHRGARAERPENTLAAFRYALEIGVDVLELDLGVSLDEKLVIAHDPTVSERCLRDGKPGPKTVILFAHTLEHLQSFDCGSVRHPLFPRQQLVPGAKIATLDELFTMVKEIERPGNGRVKFNIETKIFVGRPELTPTPEKFSALVVELIQQHGLQQRVVIQSFDPRTLIWAKKLDGSIKTALLTTKNTGERLADAQSIAADYISPQWESITAEQVQAFQKAGLTVAPWTANTVESWESLIAFGVDEIITDDPASLIDYLVANGLREKN